MIEAVYLGTSFKLRLACEGGMELLVRQPAKGALPGPARGSRSASSRTRSMSSDHADAGLRPLIAGSAHSVALMGDAIRKTRHGVARSQQSMSGLEVRGPMSSRGVWPALPALILLFVFFLFPVVRMLGFSLEGGTLEWYAKALGEGLYLRVMWNTFEIALLVTLFCLLLGYPLGFLIATTTPAWATLGFIFVLLPLWTSVLVRTYAWMVLLGRNGVFNRMLMDWGITSDPIPMLHNFTGVLIGMVHVLLPYMVLPIYGAVRRVDPAVVAAAAGLGASSWRIFWRIYIPLTLNGIFAGCVLVFVLSLGFFITPALLGGGRVIMIAVLIEQQVREALNWPFAAALSAVLLVATFAVYALAQRFTQPEARDMRRQAAQPPPADRGVRADLLLPDAAAAGGVPDLAELGALPAVPAARPVLAVVRALPRRSAVDRRHLALALHRRRHGRPRAAAGRAARLQPGARQVLRPRPGRSAGAGAHHRADHHPVGRRLWRVRQAQADRRLVRAGGGPHRAGAAVRGPGDGGGPARFRPLARAGGRGPGRQPLADADAA